MTSSRQYFYGLGKRKTSIARTKLFPKGSGEVAINGHALKKYFSGMDSENAIAPLMLFAKENDFDVEAMVEGGGKSSQSDAVRLGISRALLLSDPEMRLELKRAGFLHRDPRIKERKKPGLKRARRAPQWQKR
ncbi:30S ribosomal protein S9 [Candidatus Peribacteria bacterium RIFCSPHIGHO2_02_FULL_49_16]|nr:MAG: 30S ribosomal protein S9 [Candidatus Peribacteria bacterium RIFCSPHIGHO2_01_FULL_49_38]OGJ59716.1 MAG: 30S ribosomal protein S9 [Candidatus Peribacteria bacterium RIFCSPHIGHO2_02_FULL_49_16]